MGHRDVASSRLRVYAFLNILDPKPDTHAKWIMPDWLARRSATLTTKPARSLRRRVLRRLAATFVHSVAFGRRVWCYLWLALTTSQGDVVLLQKVLLPPFLVRFVSNRCARLVFDFDDAIQELSSSHDRRLRAMIRASDCTVTSVATGAAFAAREGAQVVTILTPVDTSRLAPLESSRPPGSARVGWIGSPSSTPYLQDIAAALTQLSRSRSLVFILIGAAHFNEAMPGSVFLPWSQEVEERVLPTLDIGLMPLRAGSWEAGKGGYKALQYLACGIPTVASDVPAGRLVVVPEVTGVLVPEGGSWAEALGRLLDDNPLRSRMRLEARRRALKDFSLAGALPSWQAAVFGVSGSATEPPQPPSEYYAQAGLRAQASSASPCPHASR